MLEFCLLALPWGVDPAIAVRSNPDSVPPIATCVRPAVMVAEPNTVCSLSMSRIADVPIIEAALQHWEIATKNAPEKSRSDREEFRRKILEEFNEHTAVAVELLAGRIRQRQLLEAFNWRLIEKTAERVHLEAVPKDETERLFYGSLRVSIEPDKGVLDQLIVVTRNHSHRIVWQAERPDKRNRIQLVRFENAVPPSPKSLLRTADSRVD